MLAHWLVMKSNEDQKILGLLSDYWWVKPGLGFSARLLTGRVKSGSLGAGPRDHIAYFRSLMGDWVQLSMVSMLFQSLCWPAGEQG